MSGAVLSERETGALFQLSGWPDSFDQSAGALMRALGFAGLGDFRRAQTAKNMTSFRTAPERIFIRAESAGDFHAALTGVDASLSPILALTGSRRIFRIAGDRAEEVLSRLAAVDFSANEFPPGAFAQAECLGTGALFHRTGESEFDAYVSRSWAESFADFAKVAGATTA